LYLPIIEKEAEEVEEEKKKKKSIHTVSSA
jgi:hypothetical protein